MAAKEEGRRKQNIRRERDITQQNDMVLFSTR